MAKQRALKSEAGDAGAKLCWSSGADYAFDKESILAYVPQDSGVYALDHFGIELFIGETGDLREALLSHYYRRDFQSDQGRPTGFTFEVCGAELRAAKAQRLIEQFQPVHQTEFVPKETWGFVSDHDMDAPNSLGANFENRFEVPADAAANSAPAPIRKRFFFLPRQLLALAATFLASLAVVFYLGIITGENLRKEPAPVSQTVETNEAVAPVEAAAVTDGGSEKRNELPVQKEAAPVESKTATVAEPRLATSAKLPDAAPPTLPVKDKSPVTALKAADEAKAAAVAKPGARAWAIQISAGKVRKALEDQVARLKTKGYDGYVVEIERDGEPWYRARVGRFSTQAEAESVRQVLESSEGLKNLITITEDSVPARVKPADPAKEAN